VGGEGGEREMTHEQLLQKIQASVKNDVDAAVRKLKSEVSAALTNFLGYNFNGQHFTPQAKEILSQLIKEDPQKGWPSWVWRTREETKLSEVLSTMDVLQRILIAKDQQENEEAQ
jgi:hypothetical protein